MSNFELSILMFLQLVVILATCRVVGFVGRKFGQPQVVGEMVAGVLLGPSLFGLVAPGVHARLFPSVAMTNIYAISQIGLVLYMFLIGVDFRADIVRRRLRSAISVSLAGIVVPFSLGSLLAVSLIRTGGFFSPDASIPEAMLFLGAAMSITAFPMLARIIYERGLSGTSFGTLALAAGSIDDAAAWCLLAVVLASFSGDVYIALTAICGGVAYVAMVAVFGRRILRGLEARVEQEGEMSQSVLAIVLILVMFGAWFTDAVGIYAVFGAFILGAAVRRGPLADALQRLLEPLTTNLLLPLFFVYSGLNTHITLVDTPYLWGITLLILLAACVGKGAACWLAARLNGEGRHESVAIGALMNARGLMELILLNIGLERGIISPTLFCIMVIMAVVTTLMATPVFEFFCRTALESPPQDLEVRVAGL